jgi:RNA 2',3'-cyclic 3'-phosphodiesterase
MRAFLALVLPTGVQRELQAAIEPLVTLLPNVAWVGADKHHLTLKFLGELADERVPEVTRALDEAALRHRPFAMELGGIGAFPTLRRARVLWLELLHHDVEVACEGAGFEIDGRLFRPHITLARVRAPLEVEQARHLAGAAQQVDFSATVPVDGITLFESTLARGGSTYRTVHVSSLQGGS